MSLSIVVGIYPDLAVDVDEEDGEEEDVVQDFDHQFAAINTVLCVAGLPEHNEPHTLEGAFPWAVEIFYSTIHTLRRVAAYLHAGKGLPPFVAAVEAAKDKLLSDLYEADSTAVAEFAHLIHHSDAGGFYLPIDFSLPIFPEAALEIDGGMLGSVQRLQAECLRLREALQIPLSLDYNDPVVEEAMWAAHETPGTGAETWQRYGVESYACLVLLAACQVSLRSGCAIVFT